MLRLGALLKPPHCFLVAHAHITAKYGPNAHSHDFAEFFWITSGSCEHRYRGGSETLVEGDLRFIRPDHIHEFKPHYSAGARLTNIALPADFIPAWRKLYPLLAGRFFWSTGSRPDGYRLTKATAEQLNHIASEMARNTSKLLGLHHFLMSLLLEAIEERHHEPPLPSWLKEGIDRIPRIFTHGVPGFVKACGRSPEHVSRATRKYLRTTPGKLINRARMDYAAQQLRMTDNNILNIMMDCGLNNSSHFYALFREYYGETPRQYRLHGHGLLGQKLHSSVDTRVDS